MSTYIGETGEQPAVPELPHVSGWGDEFLCLKWASAFGLIDLYVDEEAGGFIWGPVPCDEEHSPACTEPHLPKWLAGLCGLFKRR